MTGLKMAKRGFLLLHKITPFPLTHHKTKRTSHEELFFIQVVLFFELFVFLSVLGVGL